jgi:tetratricopeptide (TPR) repeat protein
VARAAVKAKQAQAAAQAQSAAKPSRKQRKHASGGNPSQDLFFMRLRRKQKWVFLGLAVVFAVSFTALGVGSGSGGGLEQLYNSILGGGGDAVAKAQGEIKTNPAKGYRDLATAYQTKNDLTDAIGAMKNYLKIKKTDSTAWEQVANYENQQGDTAYAQYQQALQTSQLQSPGTIFQPAGTLANQLGTNPIDEFYSTQNQNVTTPLLQQALQGYDGALADYQNAAKYAPRANRADLEITVFRVAQLAGNSKAALHALQHYVQLSPHASNLKQVEGFCKQLGGSCVPKHKTR